ncbi:stage II sporulation protein D [Thalassobacillus hwangdonensis]|uniref:Stage II sporulation protein D n=1 Tax=Thalassobacillus hwangdonensis TaxID=546108 RepID=A0ABW3L3W7_9BACI
MKRWKGPGFIVVAALLLMILILPTLIVVPFINSGETGEARVTPEKEKEPMLTTIPEDLSPFTVNVLRSKTNQVEEVPLEEYVARVVASEMPAEFEVEALKAQALAARTYIVKHMTNGEKVSGQADVTDTIQHQVYKDNNELRQQWSADYMEKMNKINTAVIDTAGKIITYESQPIFAAFFSTSNGYTENSEDYWENALPYLTSVESPWDQESPKYMDQKVIPIADAEAKLGVKFPPNVSEIKMTKTESHRVDNISINGKTFSGRDIREKLDLRSSDFTVGQKDGHLIFTTKGYGHGIGMSQYGANGMAKAGKNYEEIVQHYYKGAKVTEMNQFTALASTKN